MMAFPYSPAAIYFAAFWISSDLLFVRQPPTTNAKRTISNGKPKLALFLTRMSCHLAHEGKQSTVNCKNPNLELRTCVRLVACVSRVRPKVPLQQWPTGAIEVTLKCHSSLLAASPLSESRFSAASVFLRPQHS